MRRIVLALLYCAYLVAFVAVVDYVFFWRPFRERLSQTHREELNAPAYVDELTIRRVGSLRADRRSSFPNFAPPKPTGVVRVCAFGDSFTYGDEVADGYDFPAFLQQIFYEHGKENVQVLNFGNSWYGFHQAYLLWDGVGRRFGCDFVTLGPDCFQPERDTTFNHGGRDMTFDHGRLVFPYYLHARYVLAGGDVRRVDVLGETAAERFERYFAFVPPLRYLLYDRNPPAFLQAVLPAGRALSNPFYYDREPMTEEAYGTYVRLLARWSREQVQIVLLHSSPQIVDLANSLGKDNLVAVIAPRMERFPYLAPGGHYSSFGNRWIAEQYFALLTRGGAQPTVLTFEDVALPPAGASQPGAMPLSEVDRLYVELDGRRAGFFVVASAYERVGKPEDLAGSEIAGLIALVPAGGSIVDAAFVPTSVVPREGDTLTVRRVGAASQDAAIATVHLLDPRAPIGVARIAALKFSAGNLLVREGGLDASGPVDSEAIVLMGTTPILRADAGSPRRLHPVSGWLRTLRVAQNEYAAIAELDRTGAVTLVLEKGAANLRIALARWRKGNGKAFATSRHLKAPIELPRPAAVHQ